MPATPDSILPFRLERSNMRGRVVRLEQTIQTILDQHRYPPAVSSIVADAVLLTAMIGQDIKLRWKFSLQIRGEGAIRLIATDFFAPEHEGEPARLRAYASFDRGDVASATGTPFDLIGRGVLGVTIDQGQDMRPYQGITPLSGGSLAACAETYFAQSEQLSTRFVMLGAEAQEPGSAAGWRAGGIMIQQMPEDGGIIPDAPSGEDGLMTADDVAAMGGRTEDWNRVNHLLDTVEAYELVGPHVSAEGLLYRLFHEEVPRVYETTALTFGCTCSRARVETAMSQYSAEEIAEMTTEEGVLTADCQFCGMHYEFDPKTLGADVDR